jgi:3-oxoacyl-[acyl-carrier-protein] synthase-3
VTALEAVAAYLPDRRVPIEDLAGELGLTRMQVRVFQRYHGLSRVCRAPERTPLPLLRAAVAGLTALRGRERQVRYVLYARGMPVAVPYPRNPLHELRHDLGLDKALAFTVTHQACAASLLAVDMAGRLLAADGDTGALALVLAGEKTFTRVARIVPQTSVFAEGAAACLVSVTGQRDRLLSYVTRSRGEFDAGPAAGREQQRALDATFQKEFPGSLTEVIEAAAQRAGTTLDQISLILPHNVNVVSWRQWCKSLGFPIDRVLLDNVPAAGHSFCADPFINYRAAADRGLLQPGEKYVVAAAGAGPGATFSAMVFEH